VRYVDDHSKDRRGQRRSACDDTVQVAAEFVNRRVPGVHVKPHFGKLQDYRPEWYQQFNIVIAGPAAHSSGRPLDSHVVADSLP
jgi:hypothetical protein